MVNNDDWIIIKKNNYSISCGTLFITKKVDASIKRSAVVKNRGSTVSERAQDSFLTASDEFKNELLYGNDPSIIEQMYWKVDDMCYMITNAFNISSLINQF